MSELKNAALTFLSNQNIAIVGVSSKGDTAANFIYKKLRGKGYQVFAVNPNADMVEGDKCYKSLSTITEAIDGVIIGTHPDVTPQIIRECAEIKIRQIWIHRSIGQGSFHPAAIELAREFNIALIPGGCPLMFNEPVDFGHKCLRWFLMHSKKEKTPIGFHHK
jgi:uncharacterized protein